jgi:hypothetical protein
VRELTASGGLAPDETVHVLEVGSGAGTFALNFLDALAHTCGADGRALAPRVRYVLSDYSPLNLEEATAHPGLARLVARGTVVPAHFDLRRPDELEIPGEKKKKLPELALVIANYVACVSPLKVIRRAKDGLEEKYVRLAIEVEDASEGKAVARTLTRRRRADALPPRELLQKIKATYEWRPFDPGRGFASAVHRQVVSRVFDRLGEATINYQYSFLDLVRGLRPRVAKGGLFLISDFGNPDRSDLQGPTSDRAPVQYGLSLTHDVDFLVLDAFADEEGMGLVRTRNGLLDLHTVALRNMPAVPASFAARFERTHVRRAMGQELLDLSAAAATLFDADRFPESARIYGLCLRIAPRSTQVIHRFAEACLATNLQDTRTLEELARRLRLGQRLDLTGKHDFATLLASVYLRLGDADRARKLLERALERSESAPRHAMLALAYERLNQSEKAYRSHLRALELEPEGEPAVAAMGKLVREYLLGKNAPVGWSRRGERKRKSRADP